MFSPAGRQRRKLLRAGQAETASSIGIKRKAGPLCPLCPLCSAVRTPSATTCTAGRGMAGRGGAGRKAVDRGPAGLRAAALPRRAVHNIPWRLRPALEKVTPGEENGAKERKPALPRPARESASERQVPSVDYDARKTRTGSPNWQQQCVVQCDLSARQHGSAASRSPCKVQPQAQCSAPFVQCRGEPTERHRHSLV